MLPVSSLAANLMHEGYPIEAFEGIPMDIHQLFFYWLSEPQAVCALGGTNRSLYVMHHDAEIWKYFMNCIGAPADLAPSKYNYFDYRLITVEENLSNISDMEPKPLSKMQTIYSSDYIDTFDLIDFIDSKESITALSTFKERLLVCPEKYLTIYNASDLTFSHKISGINNPGVGSFMNNPISFGNSILCNLYVSVNSGNIVGLRTANDHSEDTMQIVLKGEDITDSKAEICAFTTLGIGKLVVATMDRQLHILNFIQ